MTVSELNRAATSVVAGLLDQAGDSRTVMRQRAVTDEQLGTARALQAEGRSIRSIAAELGVLDTTLGWNLRNRRP